MRTVSQSGQRRWDRNSRTDPLRIFYTRFSLFADREKGKSAFRVLSPTTAGKGQSRTPVGPELTDLAVERILDAILAHPKGLLLAIVCGPRPTAVRPAPSGLEAAQRRQSKLPSVQLQVNRVGNFLASALRIPELMVRQG